MGSATVKPAETCLEAVRARPQEFVVTGLMGVAVGLFVMVASNWAWKRVFPTQPVRFVSTRILTPVVPVGGHLLFQIKAQVTTDVACTGYVVREFARDSVVDGRRVWEKHRPAAGAPPIPHAGETDYVVSIQLPPDVGPGKWRFTGNTVSDCGWLHGGISNIVTTDLYFEVPPVDSPP